MKISKQLTFYCGKNAERMAWLRDLPATMERVKAKWSLTVGEPFEHGGSCSWVAPAALATGEAAVLKLAMPHMESQDEVSGLRFWDGRGCVRLLEAEEESGAMLLERCLPGTTLQSEAETKQDEIIAGLLKRFWGATPRPTDLSLFRPLRQMLNLWCSETSAQKRFWKDEALVNAGLRVFEDLCTPAPTDALLVTDLHAGNVLRSEREPWLMIDPKPFVGDCAYDPVQHLFNCEGRLHRDPLELIQRVADLAEVDAERLRLWTFARAAAEPREDWANEQWLGTARKLAP